MSRATELQDSLVFTDADFDSMLSDIAEHDLWELYFEQFGLETDIQDPFTGEEDPCRAVNWEHVTET